MDKWTERQKEKLKINAAPTGHKPECVVPVPSQVNAVRSVRKSIGHKNDKTYQVGVILEAWRYMTPQTFSTHRLAPLIFQLHPIAELAEPRPTWDSSHYAEKRGTRKKQSE